MQGQFSQEKDYKRLPNKWDLIALSIIFPIIVLLALGAQQMAAPYSIGENLPITTDIFALPHYTLRTVLRMGIALLISLIFSLAFGTLAAKYQRAEQIIIPTIDILQSLPVIGFLSITVVAFIRLFPGSLLGPECAAIFAIFTSQAWNMALSIYQSLKSVPYELQEAAKLFKLSSWQRFWRLEIPFAAPGLLWNMMISLSGGWFFVVACEAISVSNQKIMLPGIGSYIALANEQQNMFAIFMAITTMLLVILIYDQLCFRPLIKWSQKFKTEDIGSEEEYTSWVYTLFKRTRLIQKFAPILENIIDYFIHGIKLPNIKKNAYPKINSYKKLLTKFWDIFLITLIIGSIIFGGLFVLQHISFKEVFYVFSLGFITAIRVMVMIAICSAIWIPIGVWIGLRPNAAKIIQPIAQFLAAFPANLLFPIVVYLIVNYHLQVEIWTTPLMVLGTQWYILFNVIAGASALPKDIILVAKNLGVTGKLWWQKIVIPAILPYFITGALAAAGGAWNASIVAEVVNWGDTTLKATGIGAYIITNTEIGDFPRISLGIGIMCIYVLLLNRFFWQKLYDFATAATK